MELKELLGDTYKDEMTIDEINAAIADKSFVDPNTLPKSVAKETFDKTASDLAKLKKELNDVKTTQMTAEELTKQKEADATAAESHYLKLTSKLSAEKHFVAAGIGESGYAPFLDSIISEDAEQTQNVCKGIVSLIKAQRESAEKTLRAELLKQTPVPPAGNGGTIDVFKKEIEAAKTQGDDALVASLIRQQAEKQKNN